VSQENVEVVRAIFEHWGRGDFDSGDAFDAEIEFYRYGGEVVVTRQARGIDAMTAAVVELLREWRDMRFEAESFAELDSDRVLVLARLRGVGKRSGAPLDHLEASVFTLREGKVVRWDAYWEPAEARRALTIED
jgi:ketosteroid isomerase-like protein